MSREKKRQVCFRIEKAIVEEMEQTRDKTGVSAAPKIVTIKRIYNNQCSGERKST